MSLVVQKFGGTSLEDIEKLKNTAKRVAETKRLADHVVVVVSALGKTTDELVDLARQLSASPPEREMDMLLSTGEQISMALLAIALNELGEEAVSMTGQQVEIVTDKAHTKAKIRHVGTKRLFRELRKGRVVIVAGFQGVTPDGEITTLGRGGSDTTAVALAETLHADYCEIFTDVDGVFTADPRLVPEAKKISELSFMEMLEMASSGAKVLQARSVEYARNYNVPLHVRSSFHSGEGTWIKSEDEVMEKAIVSAVTHDFEEAKVTLMGLPDKPGVAASLFGALAKANINVDMIIQNVSEKKLADISFTVPKEDLQRTKKVVEELTESLGARQAIFDDKIAKISLIGAGMRSNPGIAARVFRTLANEGINIEMISTSPIKISCVVREQAGEKAVKSLHDHFGLGSSGGPKEPQGFQEPIPHEPYREDI
ncbi:MAG: aspartate kinase [Actinomycetota bacterium]|nr:aspartate kinase [Actinomycetota bacterium]